MFIAEGLEPDPINKGWVKGCEPPRVSWRVFYL